MEEFDDELYDTMAEGKEEVDEDDEELPADQEGFLRGYEEEVEEPAEEGAVEEEFEY